MKKEQRPEVALNLGPFDWFLEGIAAAGMILLLLLPAVYYTELPDTIPQHFNARGEADGFGPKTTLWLLPILGVALYTLLTILVRVPHTFNYSVQITSENAEQQYRMATQMIRVLKVLIVGLFAYLIQGIIRVATAQTTALDERMMWFFVGTILITVVGYTILSFRKR
jgi:uncharacterized membrane protein